MGAGGDYVVVFINYHFFLNMQKYQPFEGNPYKLCDVYFMDVILLRRIINRVSFDF